MEALSNDYLGRHKKFRIDSKKLATAFCITAFVIAIIVFWLLKLVGITATGDAFCGLEEHTHGDECYISELVCGYDSETTKAPETEVSQQEENSDEETTDSDEAVTGESAAEEEKPAEEETTTVKVHTHSDECCEKILVCKEAEHTHNQECFPDKTADTETVSDWLSTIEKVEITNDIPENLVAVAMSQTGYEESSRNYEFDSDGNRNGYTRYGEWYGNPYGKWNVMFVSFCLHYSNINNSDELKTAGAEAMRLLWQKRNAYAAAGEYTAQRGDIAFIDSDGDGVSDTAGIILSADSNNLSVIMGDSNDKVETKNVKVSDGVVGYGLTGELSFSKDMDYEAETTVPETETAETEMLKAPMLMMAADETGETDETEAEIIYINDLSSVVRDVSIRTQDGVEINKDSSVYIGQTYVISIEFSEDNEGDKWIQFRHDDHHELHYQIPENLHCEPFTDWHYISAKTENGTVEDVAKYWIDENGHLRVIFVDIDGQCFASKYSNVDFTIEFNATVGDTGSGDKTEIVFNDEIKVNLNIDRKSHLKVEKTHGDFDRENNTMEYTVRVEAFNGAVTDLVLDDKIWEKHYALRDTIVVTDLDGNLIDPQPEISDNPNGSSGFILSGFPDIPAGEGLLIKYKTKLNNDQLNYEVVNLWNEAWVSGKGTDDTELQESSKLGSKAYLYKIKKDGKQDVINKNGEEIPVVRWDVEIVKDKENLGGTVIIDTLGAGLHYYTDEPIRVDREDANDKELPTVYINWNDVTIKDNSMSFELPEGHAFKIVYYTLYDALSDAQDKEVFTNEVHAYIDGKDESDTGSADVVGFTPVVNKSARGDDGKYVYYTINAEVPGVIKNWGNFFLTDLSAVWNYPEKGQTLYIQNVPQDMEITATVGDRVINFTPYVEGGHIENTFILVAPAQGNQHHSFNVYFNTSTPTAESSKWILGEDAKLTITYKIPFSAKTGSEWSGSLTGELTLEDVLLQKETVWNEAYLNFTDIISGRGEAPYNYTPKITKKAVVNEDGTIDYTVAFNTSIPGTSGPQGYLYAADDIRFTDTFDEKLEYVPGSLSVTCYSPWFVDEWYVRYDYGGAVTGNSMNVSASDFKLAEINMEQPEDITSWMVWLPDYQAYCDGVSGGKQIFKYKLRLKKQYLETTEENKYLLDNTAEVIWDGDNSSGTASRTVEYRTGLLDKYAVQESNKLLFDIHINRNALDILEGSDTLTIEDTMTPNLSVYWDSIKLLYQEADGSWTSFSDSDKYTYTVTYDQPSNKLNFVVPDELHIRIDYTTLLISSSDEVSVNNTVKIDGKAEVSDVIDAVFKVEEHSGGASGSIHSITLIKQDGDTDERLPDVTFHFYGPMPDPDAVLPDGAPKNIQTDSGKQLGYIGSYTTGADGTVLIETQYLTTGGPYALIEASPPDGYLALEKPVFFHFYEAKTNDVIPVVSTIISVENFNYGFVLPETGGTGTLPLAIIGFSLMAFPILYSTIRRKRERGVT